MRKVILLLIILFLLPVSSISTIDLMHVWKSDTVSLTMIDNYGTTLSEKIRAENQAMKAYYFFNILNEEGVESNVILYPNSKEGKEQDQVAVLKAESLSNMFGANFTGKDKFNPVYDERKLLFQQWGGNNLELISEGISIYKSPDGFNLIGKRKENILIRVNGELLYLSEDKWAPVEALKGISVDYFAWLGQESFVCHGENNETGKTRLVIASVRKPESESFNLPKGNFISAAVSDDLKQIYVLVNDGSVSKIYGYSRTDNEWIIRRESMKDIVLLGVRNSQVIWRDNTEKFINISDGQKIGIDSEKVIKCYPEGKYLTGETKESLKAVNAEKIRVIFYKNSEEKKVHASGISKIEKFSSKPAVWLLPESYLSSFDSFPSEIGHAYFSIESMHVYYDNVKNGVRDIVNLKLRPAAPREYVLIFLGVLLLALLVNTLTGKTKGYRK